MEFWDMEEQSKSRKNENDVRFMSCYLRKKKKKVEATSKII